MNCPKGHNWVDGGTFFKPVLNHERCMRCGAKKNTPNKQVENLLCYTELKNLGKLPAR